MPFKKGQSGNPGGKKKPLGLSDAVRQSEGQKTWAILLKIRDQKVKEQQYDHKTGEVYDVVPSVKEVREASKLILAYCWGQPVQSHELGGKDGGPVAVSITFTSN